MVSTTSKKPSLGGTEPKGWYSLSNLKILSEELKRLESEDKELYFQTVSLIVRSGIARFADYIRKEGKRGMVIAQNAAKWIDNSEVKNFRDQEKLLSGFRSGRKILGEVWYKRWQYLRDEDEYLGIVRKIISDSRSKKMMWAAPGLVGVRPHLGYLYKERDQKPILVVIDQDGFIENAEVIKPIWQEILPMMDSFHKIDDFADELLLPLVIRG